MGTLVNEIPKVLLPIHGKALIEYHLENLQRADVTDVVINLHYLPEKIIEKLGDGAQYGLTIHYSPEAELLGLGGGVHNALPLLGDEPFLVISGDMWTDYEFANLPKKIESVAHIVLVDNPTFHPEGDYSLDDYFVTAPAEQTYNYAGFGVFTPELFKKAGPGSYGIKKLLDGSIANKKVSGEYFSGRWANLNTPAELDKIREQL
jgi:MurNAc alpha-1-phosphate uridylyltransferase